MPPAAGVDLGGTKVLAVVADRKGKVLGEAKRTTPSTGGPAAVVEEISGAVTMAAKDAKVPVSKLAGIGIGSPGAVSPRSGEVKGAANLPGFDQPVPLAALVSEALDVRRVRLDNDVNVGTVAEHQLGAGRGFDDLLVVFSGSGVGGGLILGGRLYPGAHGAAGEIGHMVVVQGGELCPCGRLGCAEAYAGRLAMERAARAAAAAGRPTELLAIQERRQRARMTSGVFAEALELGDPLAHELVERAVQALATAIASAVNLLDVQAVLIGGGLGDKLGGPFVQRVKTAMIPHLFVRPSPLEVLPCALGDLSGALGAAMLVHELKEA
ncbi:MAG TPA: ROK family protein [Actinomycetes bacterium]|jgi:glucokinase|nr:ROK family protein [Actinomycetes bacterium]